jgi:uncharacterized protein (TIGR03437 family)
VGSGAIFNAASFAVDAPVAPGSLISIFGSKLTSGAEVKAQRLPLPTQLGDTQVTLAGVALPLLYTSDGQVNAQVPYDIPLNLPAQLTVQRGDAMSVPKTVSVAPAQPAVFTTNQLGQGQGVIVNSATNVIADAKTPVKTGDIVIIYCTGLGAVTGSVQPGVAVAGPTPTAQSVTVTIGGRAANVTYAGLTPGQAGLYQVNAVVPAGVVAGSDVPVILSAAGQSSPPVTIVVQ